VATLRGDIHNRLEKETMASPRGFERAEEGAVRFEFVDQIEADGIDRVKRKGSTRRAAARKGKSLVGG